ESCPARVDLALEGEPVEGKAALRGQVGEGPADLGDAVRVLDGADVVAGLVAPDRDGLACDDGGLSGEAGGRLGACVLSAPVPPPPRRARRRPPGKGGRSPGPLFPCRPLSSPPGPR